MNRVITAYLISVRIEVIINCSKRCNFIHYPRPCVGVRDRNQLDYHNFCYILRFAVEYVIFPVDR